MSTSRHLFTRDLLGSLLVPGSYANALAIIAQCQAEGSPARFNPLATTLYREGSTAYNSVGVRNYASYAQGVEATAATLRQANMRPLLDALKAGTSSLAYWHALDAAPWGTEPPGNMTAAMFLDDTRRHWYTRAMYPVAGT